MFGLFGAGVKFIMVTVMLPGAGQTSGTISANPYPTMDICVTDLNSAPPQAGVGRSCMSIADYKRMVKTGQSMPVAATQNAPSVQEVEQAKKFAEQQARYEKQLADFKKATADAEKLQAQINADHDAAQRKYEDELQAAQHINAKKK